MPPTFVTVDSVVFDFGSNIISIPAAFSSIDAQWLIDHCRLAEESSVGLSRPSIVSGSGKVTIDIDSNGNPIKTGVLAVLNGWKIATQKTSGSFTIKDIYEEDNSIPYLEPSPVPVKYQQSIGGVILQDTGTGVTPAQVWQYSDRTLTVDPTNSAALVSQIENSTVLAKQADVSAVGAQLIDSFAAVMEAIANLPETATVAQLKSHIDEIYLLHGLDSNAPLLVTDTQRIAGGITQSIATTSTQTTVTRQ